MDPAKADEPGTTTKAPRSDETDRSFLRVRFSWSYWLIIAALFYRLTATHESLAFVLTIPFVILGFGGYVVLPPSSTERETRRTESSTQWTAFLERENETVAPRLRFVRVRETSDSEEGPNRSLPTEFSFRIDRRTATEALVVFGEDAAARKYCHTHVGPRVTNARELEDLCAEGGLNMETRHGRVVVGLDSHHVLNTLRAMSQPSRHAVCCRDTLCRDALEDFCMSNGVRIPLLSLHRRG